MLRLPSARGAARALPFALSFTLVAVAGSAGAQGGRPPLTMGSVLQFDGTATATDLGIPGVRLDFAPTVRAATTGNSGAFASLNRDRGPGVAGSIDDVLVGVGPQPVRNFLVIGGYRFDLFGLPSGAFTSASCYVAPAAGQTCTPYQSPLFQPGPEWPLSPFMMQNIATGDPAAPLASSIFFRLYGNVTGPGNETMAFAGTIGALFPFSFQEVLAGLEGLGSVGQGIPDVPFTGRFEVVGPAQVSATVIPEPSTWALAAAGLAGVAAVARRRRRA